MLIIVFVLFLISNNLNRILDLFFSNFKCEVLKSENPMLKEDLYDPVLNVAFSLMDSFYKQFNMNTNILI